MSYSLYYSTAALDDLDRIWMEDWDVSRDFDTADAYIDDLQKTAAKKKHIRK